MANQHPREKTEKEALAEGADRAIFELAKVAYNDTTAENRPAARMLFHMACMLAEVRSGLVGDKISAQYMKERFDLVMKNLNWHNNAIKPKQDTKRFTDKHGHYFILAVFEGEYVRFSREEGNQLEGEEVVTKKEFSDMLVSEGWKEVEA